MERSELTITVLAAAAFAAAIMLSPSGTRADVGDLVSGLYVGAGIGQAQHDDACGAPGRVLTICDDQDTAWKSYTGYQVNNAVDQVPIPPDVMFLNKTAILGKIGTPRWDRERNTSSVNTSDAGWAFAWGPGLQYTLHERLGTRPEWERFNSLGNANVNEGDIRMWTMGVNFKF